MNRLNLKTYPDSTTVNYTYDKASRLTQVVDPTGTYSFTFDNMGRLTNTTTQYAFLTGRNFTTSYSYDAASNRTGFTDPESGSSTYAYDTLNRLQTLTPPSAISSGNFGFGYDGLNRRTSLTRPNSVNTSYSYDNLSRLLSVTHAKSGTTIDGATYTVDNAGNRTAKTDQRTAVTTNYGYDAMYQLLSATQGATTTESYVYDSVGNRTASLGVPTYTTNTSSELTATSNASYTYDYNGNMLTKVVGSNTTTYAWDFENRMTSVTLPGSGGTVSFKYDFLGRRIYKSSPNGTSIYAYDRDSLIEETNSGGTAVARYAQGPNIDETLAMLRNSSTSYYHDDGVGTITSLANTAGSLAETYTLDSFGKTTNSTGSLTNPFQYTGREFDSETSLYYYRARYYDSGTGRFTREDPLGFYGGDVDFYRYVWNSSTNLVDPGGEFGLGLSLGATGEAGLIGVGAGATGSVGGGVFFNGSSPSIGGFASGGAFAGGPGWGPSAPSLPSRNNWVLGAFAGGGLGIWGSNAKNVGDLAGPFKTYSVNAGWFWRAATIQFSIGKNSCGKTIWLINYGGPVGVPSGVGWGGSISGYNTNTKTVGKGSGGEDCGCN